MPIMSDKNEILSEELYNEFNSFDLLDAVGYLDKMRQYLADRVSYEPPQIREDLMKLHEMVMDASNGSNEYTIDDLTGQLGDIETDIYAIQEEADKMLRIFSDLNTVLNSAYNRIEEEK